MGCFDTFTNNVFAGLLISCALISIGISSWQYQNGDGGHDITIDGASANWNSDVCNAFPYEYMRPFQLKIDGCNSNCNPVFCGYSKGNTGYRLAVAIMTLFLGVIMIFKVLEKDEKIKYFTLLLHMVIWFSVFVADSAQLSSATQACSEKYFFFINGSKCENSKYGITIAVDIAICFVSFFVWYGLSYLAGVSAASITSGSSNRASLNTPAPNPVANAPEEKPASKSWFA